MKSNANSAEEQVSLKVLIWFVIAIVAMFSIYSVAILLLYPDLRDRGLLGDQFGGLNSLFAGLAFAGLIYTIHLQRRELSLQRKELELTREELVGQREQLEGQKEQLSIQNTTLQEQGRERTFLSLMELYSEAVSRVVWNGKRDKLAFDSFYHTVRRNCDEQSEFLTGRNDMNYLSNQILGQVQYARDEFRSYAHTIAFTLAYVFRGGQEPGDWMLSFAVNQLTRYEVLFLFYYCALHPAGAEYAALFTEIGLFAELDTELLIHRDHRELWHEEAYAKSWD